MSAPSTLRPHVGIIGGGISGLAAAHYVLQSAPETTVTLLEAQNRVGGVLRTGHHDGYLHEQAADNFLATPDMPWVRQLAEQVGYADELIETNRQHRRALVWWNGQLHPIPEGFQLMATANPWPIFRSRLLTWRGKTRLACERFIRKRTDMHDESLAEFATRRLGREAYERLVQPLVAGIYTADPDRLSVAAALPQFPAMEQQYGSLTQAMLQRARDGRKENGAGARYSMFCTPRHGMQHFMDHLAHTLPATTIRTGAAVKKIVRQEMNSIQRGAWRVFVEGESEAFQFDGLILALPTWQAALLLADVDHELAATLKEIRYADAAVVALALRCDQLSRAADAFGIVVPAAASRQILAVSFSSVKFPGRAPDGHILLRVFVGGARQESLVDLDDDAMKQLVRRELQTVIGLREPPQWWHIQRWRRATPQYEVGHLDRLARIEQRLASHPTLGLAGNGYRGVGMPQCVRSGQQAADRVVNACRRARS